MLACNDWACLEEDEYDVYATLCVKAAIADGLYKGDVVFNVDTSPSDSSASDIIQVRRVHARHHSNDNFRACRLW